ncbi:MAG: Unknown protein [uncultured Campylobacterales bacterium]|uniref:Uncharacterized protein n=1 Tax=uncultured Campylobacterales bacterium TaxID=352960 RepID=A0A6S6T8F3_9BACT|nr:MAG: Unknown protein [uncultured Campylobacterales bacterium]
MMDINKKSKQIKSETVKSSTPSTISIQKKEESLPIKKKRVKINEKTIEVSNPFTFKKNKDLLTKYQSLKINNSSDKLYRFSESFFKNSNKLEPSNLPTPNKYKLKTKDILKITINGPKYIEYKVQIDKNGNINVPNVGNINIANQTFIDAKNKIKNRLETAYPNIDIFIDVNEFASIQIQISGNVKNPGIYNIPAFSSIKDVLILSNGINNIGSLRNIKLISGDKIHTIDLYKVFGASQANDTLLKNKDKIYIPKADKLISLKGEVSSPAIYELKNSENFRSLFKYASGLSPKANKNKIKLTRYQNNKTRKTYTLSLNQLYSYYPVNGDTIEIYPISVLESMQVLIQGNILRSGSYEIPSDKSLKTLILKSQKQGNFFLSNLSDVVSIKRNSLKNNTIEITSLENILNGLEKISLNTNDEVYFFNNLELKENPYIYVKGRVLTAPVKIQFNSNMRIKNLSNIVNFRNEIYLDVDNNECKNLKKNCRRELIKNDKNVLIKRITNDGIKEYLIDTSTNPYFELKAFDEVEYFDYYQNNKKIQVSIYGEILRSGVYNKVSNMILSDLIELSGGLNKKAYTNKIEIVRYSIINNQREKKVYTLSLNKNLNFKLEDDDEVFIRRIPNYNDKKSVYLSGEIMFPGRYAIENGESLADIIIRAGGYSRNAFLDGAVFTRASIKELQKIELDKSLRELKTKSALIAASPEDIGEDKSNLMANINNIIEEAKKIEVIGRLSIDLNNELDSNYTILENNDRLYIPTVNSTVTIVGEVFNPTSFVYKPNLKLQDYLKKAGGLKYSADNKSIYIVKANGEAKKVKNGWFFKDNPTISLGEIIVIPKKINIKSKMSIFKDVAEITYKLAVTIASLHTVGAI